MSWQQNICRKDIFAFCKRKPTLIKAGMCHIQDESKEEIAYAQDMFETIFKDYALKTYNKDVGEKQPSMSHRALPTTNTTPHTLQPAVS